MGENVIFHVRSNFFLEDFQYVILSEGRILTSRLIGMAETNIKTFDVQVTPEMAPSSDITVWHITRDGSLVSASTAFVVSSQGKNDVRTDATAVGCEHMA